MGRPIHGLLATKSVELPFENAKKQAEADKTNAEIAHLGFRVGRRAYDWGVRSYKNTSSRDVQLLKSGDLVKVFKTVSAGIVAWEGTVDFDYTNYHHGLQKGLKARGWSTMFNQQLPAKLESDGKVIYGALEPFCETGTEGVVWSVYEYGQAGYDGLNCLKNGDRLTIYRSVKDGEVEWEGPVDFGPEQVSKVGWSEVLRETKHMKTEDWLQMNWQSRPVIVKPAP